MTSLFSNKITTKKRKKTINETEENEENEENKIKEVKEEKERREEEIEIKEIDIYNKELNTFHELGLTNWICNSCNAMGFKRPTPIQQTCIPAILSGKNVMGCAETGSGKTAAFALPMLQHLSEDPYGIYGVILTPTRELAIQIQEQIIALGSFIGVRTCLIIGGMGIIDQSIALSRLPHIIIATPGRLRHHIQSSSPPNLSRSKYLILDEADRLLLTEFETDLLIIIQNMTHQKRQTLLFSATLTNSLKDLQNITLLSTNILKFDLTKSIINDNINTSSSSSSSSLIDGNGVEENQNSTSSSSIIPTTLQQQYIFIPANIKMCYLVALILKLYKHEQDLKSLQNEELNLTNKKQKKSKKNNLANELLNISSSSSSTTTSASGNSETTTQQQIKLQSSIIIFTNSCKTCQMLFEIFSYLHISSVPLHSLLSQSHRLSSLTQFKNQSINILISTDITSRGIDIPTVTHVINYDVPHSYIDYIHRVGRTARAGRNGRSITFITPNEISLIHDIESHIKTKLTESTEVIPDDVVPLLNTIAKAIKYSELRMIEIENKNSHKLNNKLKYKMNEKKKKLKKLRSSNNSNSNNDGTNSG